MGIRHQERQATEIANQTDWKSELENLFVEMNRGVGQYIAMQNPITETNLIVNNIRVRVFIGMEIIEEVDNG